MQCILPTEDPLYSKTFVERIWREISFFACVSQIGSAGKGALMMAKGAA